MRIGRLAAAFATACAAATAAAVSLAASLASAHAPRCPIETTGVVGSAGAVHAIPHGCVWLAAESRERSTKPPLVVSRVHGDVRRFRLPATPFGVATGYCWVNVFVVEWPYIVVSVAPRVGTECRGGFDGEPMTWIAKFNRFGTSRTIFTSTPIGS